MPYASRYHRPKDLPPFVLQERDRQVLAAVFRYRYLTREHVQALAFGAASARVVQVRLRHLFAHGYLDRYFLPVVIACDDATHPVTSRPLYCLARSGAQVVADRLGIAPEQVPSTRRANAAGFATMIHHLVAIDFLVACEAALRHRTDVTLGRVETETNLRQIAAQAKERERGPLIVPDGAITLRYPGRGPITFYFEVVRAGVKAGNTSLVAKFKRYAELVHAGFFRRRYGHETVRAVLIATSSWARAKRLRTLAEKLPHGRSLFWFTCYERRSGTARVLPQTTFEPSTVLDHPWHDAMGQPRTLTQPF